MPIKSVGWHLALLRVMTNLPGKAHRSQRATGTEQLSEEGAFHETWTSGFGRHPGYRRRPGTWPNESAGRTAHGLARYSRDLWECQVHGSGGKRGQPGQSELAAGRSFQE